MIALGVISFIIGGFVGTSIMALCVAHVMKRTGENEMQTTLSLNDFINKASEER